MKLVVGLGNPGTDYENTRHNAGFLAIDYLLEYWKKEGRIEKPTVVKDKKYIAYETRYTLNDGKQEDVTFFKPLTFMNLSGTAVKEYISYNKKISTSKDVWILHDELDIMFGKIKVDYNRSSAGHNGVQNIVDILGTKEFARIRIGVAPEVPGRMSGEQYVLKNFSVAQKKVLPDVFEMISIALVQGIQFGYTTAQNTANKK